jgi:uncharacterized Zn finger protein (UPF0148 family)
MSSQDSIFQGKKLVSKSLLLDPEKNKIKNSEILFGETSDIKLMDTRTYLNFGDCPDSKKEDVILEDIPEKITGTFTLDYNILYVDNIIKKKLSQEKFTVLPNLKLSLASLEKIIMKPQTYILREKSLNSMAIISAEIAKIESLEKLHTYISRASDLIKQYRLSSSKVKRQMFESEDINLESDENTVRRLSIIDKYLDIASDYMELDIIRVNSRKSDICNGCGFSLTKIALNEEGTVRCPECQTEHAVIITTKLSKDSARINMNTNMEDESIDNFLRAFTRYQGLQPDQPDEKIYAKLDEYFVRNGRATGKEIKQLQLDRRGFRGDTNHKMLWDALSHIGHSEYYEDTNLIGHLYWGWTLPNVSHLKERLIDKYIKTQKVFYEIPIEERGRNSSLGTQYRLWRQLQLEGHECYMSEFKLAENPESVRTHHRLWKMMCERANHQDIYYIP